MSKGYRITASTGIHKGDRTYQQDQVNFLTHIRVAGCVLGIVADGMGGRSGGRKASDQVMMTSKQLFDRYDPETDNAPAMLKQIFEEAHIVIRLTAVSAEEEPHSTAAVFVINPNGECHWIHTGDSRIYHFEGDTPIHRTKDHSYVQTLVDKGELTEFQANIHPQSNILMGCLGTERSPPVGIHLIPQLKIGDTLMACSDGVWHYFSAKEIGTAVSMLSPRDASEFLIQEARTRARRSGDNLSLVIVKIESLS